MIKNNGRSISATFFPPCLWLSLLRKIAFQRFAGGGILHPPSAILQPLPLPAFRGRLTGKYAGEVKPPHQTRRRLAMAGVFFISGRHFHLPRIGCGLRHNERERIFTELHKDPASRRLGGEEDFPCDFAASSPCSPHCLTFMDAPARLSKVDRREWPHRLAARKNEQRQQRAQRPRRVCPFVQTGCSYLL